MMQMRTGLQDEFEARGQAITTPAVPADMASQIAELDSTLLARLDGQGFPACEALVGDRGLWTLVAPDRLVLRAAALGGRLIAAGEPVALLAFVGQNRLRRLRVAGIVADTGPREMTVLVHQVLTNSSRYVHHRARANVPREQPAGTPTSCDWLNHLDDTMRAVASDAETLFVATRHAEPGTADQHGLAVSHRGGLPGFVVAPDEHTLLWPELPGIGHLSTLENLILDGRCGLLMLAAGHSVAVRLSGRAEVLWRDAEAKRLTGCDRAVRFRVERACLVPDRYGSAWVLRHYSPDFAGEPRPPSAATRHRLLRIVRKVDEAQDVISLYFEDVSGRPLVPFSAGQHLVLKLPDSLERKYTVSAYSPLPTNYRITVKRLRSDAGPEGRASSHLHDTAVRGDVLQATGPRGNFRLPPRLARPLVLASAGIGITPMVAMVEELALRAPHHPVWFLHGNRNGRTFALSGKIRSLRADLPDARWHVRFSQPRDSDRIGVDYDAPGRIDLDVLQTLLPFGSYDFYLCGPDDFVYGLAGDLRRIDVPSERINVEAFGAAGDIEAASTALAGPPSLNDLHPRMVRFARSGKAALWDIKKGTLLDFAQELGLEAPHSCRTGMCGACAQRLLSGEVAPVRETFARPEADHILLCSCMPSTDVELDL